MQPINFHKNVLFLQSIRKTIFMTLIILMILCYAGFLFVPIIPAQKIPRQSTFNFTSIDGACDKQLTVEYKHLCKQNKNET